MIDRATSGEIKDVTEWATKQAGIAPGNRPLRACLTAALSELKPQQVTVDRVLITVLGKLEELGTDLTTANAMAAIDVRPAFYAGPKLPFWRQWFRWLRTSFFTPTKMKGA